MCPRSVRRSGRLICGTTAGLLALSLGCISGSLASSTGPRDPGQRWSDANRQMVVLGEEVQFDFVLQDWKRRLVSPRGVADYCVAYVGAERIECEADVYGHFSFSHIFDRYRPGDVVAVRAAAFQQRGSRDYMKIAGQWMHNDSPYELSDRKGASDSITLTVYESPIELAVGTAGTPLDPGTAVLRIRKGSDSAVSILIERPDRPGFSLGGPEKNGSYILRYLPRRDELNTYGRTEIEFTVRDVAGRTFRVQSVIETP
ncbi:MAG: hypothetical protein IIC51_06020 [Planctomycetes bacterium]|nr:hypothetical protein [Planctomycetota bacterium]